MSGEARLRVMLVLVASAIVCFALALDGGRRPVNVIYVEGAPPAETQAPAESAAASAQEVLVEKSVNINTATLEELCALPGIGPVTAGRIIAYREENGGFYDIEELTEVTGIGEKTLARLEPYITS